MTYPLNLLAGWTGFLGGAVSCKLIGLFFQRKNWLGSYTSFVRRELERDNATTAE